MTTTTEVKRTERGWAGHFILCDRCCFRRNTLIEYGDKKWVVSTVGNMRIKNGNYSYPMQQIAHNTYYETMAFEVDPESPYLDGDVTKEITINSDWRLRADSVEEFIKEHPLADNDADEMHERIVNELMERIKQ